MGSMTRYRKINLCFNDMSIISPLLFSSNDSFCWILSGILLVWKTGSITRIFTVHTSVLYGFLPFLRKTQFYSFSVKSNLTTPRINDNNKSYGYCDHQITPACFYSITYNSPTVAIHRLRHEAVSQTLTDHTHLFRGLHMFVAGNLVIPWSEKKQSEQKSYKG